MAVVSLCAQAAVQLPELPGLGFNHHDWELACDNTRTCRAAGYQRNEDELTVSVLLTRKAGPDEPVTAQLMIGNYGEEVLNQLPSVLNLSMKINNQSLGKVEVKKDKLVANLSPSQTAALLAALNRSSTIEWSSGKYRWRLSDKGAAAVLLKMDEFQGRVGTRGALVKKGTLGEEGVLKPLPLPVVRATPLAKPRPGDKQLAEKTPKVLWEALRATVDEDSCPVLVEGKEGKRGGKEELSVVRLSEKQLLVSTACWTAAYNLGYGFWVVNDTPPYKPELVTPSGSHFKDGKISDGQKGRGLGDCWSFEVWTWGKPPGVEESQFVHTESSSTGMCRFIAPGGAWSLPVRIMDVRR